MTRNILLFFFLKMCEYGETCAVVWQGVCGLCQSDGMGLGSRDGDGDGDGDGVMSHDSRVMTHE